MEVLLRIDSLKLDLEGAVENQQVINRFAAAERDLATSLEQQQQLQEAYEEVEGSMQTRLERWTDSVNGVVKKLSDYFNEYMAALQYAGKVTLRQTGLISQYEIVMHVSFRQDAPLCELDGQKQSGGERAVSTIMYLMAMQELTSSPFRVVDEINQGMDERNERLVFDRIVTSCCTGVSKPQYFLVSPKLLQGLNSMSHPNVTALMVWNGGGVLTPWQLPEMIRCLKRKRDRLLEEVSAND